MFPQVLWPIQDPQARYPIKAYSIQLWICYLWCGQRTCQNLTTPSRQVPPPHKHNPGICGTGQTHHSSARVPIDPALKIINDQLVKDPTLKDRTVIGMDDIILLLEFCLKIPISPSKASSLNRLRVQPWVPQ